jgi:hypothetical protein
LLTTHNIGYETMVADEDTCMHFNDSTKLIKKCDDLLS